MRKQSWIQNLEFIEPSLTENTKRKTEYNSVSGILNSPSEMSKQI